MLLSVAADTGLRIGFDLEACVLDGLVAGCTIDFISCGDFWVVELIAATSAKLNPDLIA